MSKNSITIDQLKLACRHVEEMRKAHVTENLAIRTLELFADVYATLKVYGTTGPLHVDQIELWSIEAIKLRDAKPDVKADFRIEHGTPRRDFARKILKLYDESQLSTERMNGLVERYYRLAVITLKEDQDINKVLDRSIVFTKPEKKWAAAGIRFPS